MNAYAAKSNRGFTLLELIIVIILLGVMSVGLGGLIRLSTTIYTEATDRDELISSGRFAVERLNREIRAALPNSLQAKGFLSNTIHCLYFFPTVASAVYEDIPVSPELPSNVFTVIPFNNSELAGSISAVVYPLNPGELYGASSKVSSVRVFPNSGNGWQVTLDSAVVFAEDSPTKRVYFVGSPVSYCARDGQLTRHEGDTPNSTTPPTGGVLMAEHIDVSGDLPFVVNDAVNNRTATVEARLTFVINDESMTFNNEIQVVNVP